MATTRKQAARAAFPAIDAAAEAAVPRPAPGIPRARSQPREAQLLDIARELFGRKGYDRTSLRDIAEEAGITKAALYYHFPDKDALYERVVLESLERLIAHVEAAMVGATTAIERIHVFFAATATYLDHNRDAWSAGSSAFWSDLSDRRAAALQRRDRFEHLLRQAIIDGVASGELRQVDPSLAGKFLLSSFGHITRWHSPTGPLSVSAVMQHFVDYALYGLANPAHAPTTT